MAPRTRLTATLDPTKVEHAGLSPGSGRTVGSSTLVFTADAANAEASAAAALASQAAAAASQAAAAASQAAAAASAAEALADAGDAEAARAAAVIAQNAAQASQTAAATSAAAALASQNAAATSATNASTSATAAAGSQAAAATSAAAALASQNAASTSASNAATSATSAGNSATAAATSATNAANSATAAAASAAAAATFNPANYVEIAGDTMTGNLTVNRTGDAAQVAIISDQWATLSLRDTGAAADQKRYDIGSVDGRLDFQRMTDAAAVAETVLSFSTSGTATFSDGATFGSSISAAGWATFTAGSAGVRLNNSSGGANTKLFGLHSESNTFTINAYNDAGVWQRTCAYWDHATGKYTSAYTLEANGLITKGTWPGIEFWDTDAAAGSKRALLKYADKELVLIRLDDAGAIVDYPFSVLPTGITQFGYGFDASTDSRVRGVLNVQRNAGGNVRLTTDGGADRTGWIEWRRQDTTRVGYMGYIQNGDNSMYYTFETGGGVFHISAGSINPQWGYVGRAGPSGAAANLFNIYWTGTRADLYIDSSNQGSIPAGTYSTHWGVAKVACSFDNAGGLGFAHNTSSVTDNGTGSWTVNYGVTFSGGYVVSTSIGYSSGGGNTALITNAIATSLTINNRNQSGTNVDATYGYINVLVYGNAS